MRRHHGEPQARGAGGHRRRADRLGEDALLERPLARPRRPRRRRRRSAARSASGRPAPAGPAAASASRSTAALRCSFSTRRGCSRSSSSAAIAAATAGGGSAVEKISVRAVLIRYLAIWRVAADVGAVGAERLAERARRSRRPRPRARPPRPRRARRGRRAGAVRLVDHHARVVALRQLDDPLERRHVAVHREHAVGHDQRAAALGLAQAPLEVVGVAVVVDERLRARRAGSRR